jgi:Type II secretion system protein C
MSQRLAVGLMLVVLALMLASGYWLWGRLQDLAPPAPAAPTPTVAATRTVTPVPTIVTAPPGYRLAGVAVGEPDSFAVVESSAGSSALYRVGDDVPGLGRLMHIEAERVVLQTEGGQFELWLTPASTATPGAHATVEPTHRPVPTPAPRTKRRPRVPAAGTARESTP